MKKFLSKDGIASWKIDSPIERWLAKKADNSHFWKSLYVNFYKTFDREYYLNGLPIIERNIQRFIGEATRKQKRVYEQDMIYSLHRFGCMFDEYFLFQYEYLNSTGRESFITDKTRWEYYDQMNSRDNLDVFNDKRKAYETFKEFYKRELIEVSCDDDYDVFLDFYNRHDKMIVKPQKGSGGKGIFILAKHKYASFEDAFAEVRKIGSVVIEELIIQASEMSVLNPDTVNTVRVPTIKMNDEIVVFHPFLRMGCGDSVVDNAASGGIFAEVCAESGIVITKGVTEFGDSFVKHPISQVVLPGFQIPRWNEAVALVKRLAQVLETNNYVGWDLALTNDGWIMVEGNPRGQFVSQIPSKNGIKAELESYIQKM